MRSFFCSPMRAAMFSLAELTSCGSGASGCSSPVSESFSLSSFLSSSLHFCARRLFSWSQLEWPGESASVSPWQIATSRALAMPNC